MAAATRPGAGTPVEAGWGQQVHDVAVVARGVTVSGAAGAVGGTNPHVALDTVLGGSAAMVDLAANEFVAPMDGLYELVWSLIGAGYTGGAYRANLYGPVGTFSGYGTQWPAPSSAGARVTLTGLVQLTAGQRAFMEGTNATGGSGTATLQCERATFRLIAQGLG